MGKVFWHVVNSLLFKTFSNEITNIDCSLNLEEVLQATRLESHGIRMLKILFNINFPLNNFSSLLEAIQKMSHSITAKGRSVFIGIFFDNSFKTITSIKDHKIYVRNPTDPLDVWNVMTFDEI